jgi:hypothetical protein
MPLPLNNTVIPLVGVLDSWVKAQMVREVQVQLPRTVLLPVVVEEAEEPLVLQVV